MAGSNVEAKGRFRLEEVLDSTVSSIASLHSFTLECLLVASRRSRGCLIETNSTRRLVVVEARHAA